MTSSVVQGPAGWLYRSLRIQAHPRTHLFAVDWARSNLPPGAAVLDVAAGQGALSQALLDAGFAVAATAWNDKFRPDVLRYRLDLDHPFGPEQVGGEYDLVCAIEIIEHVENPAAFLRSLSAVLAPRGRIILSTPNVESARARLQWLWRGCPGAFSTGEVTKNRHISMIWRQGLEHLVGCAGLEIAERRFFRRRTSWSRAVLYRTLEMLLQGEPGGETRLYVLRRAAERIDHRPNAVI